MNFPDGFYIVKVRNGDKVDLDLAEIMNGDSAYLTGFDYALIVGEDVWPIARIDLETLKIEVL